MVKSRWNFYKSNTYTHLYRPSSLVITTAPGANVLGGDAALGTEVGGDAKSPKTSTKRLVEDGAGTWELGGDPAIPKRSPVVAGNYFK